MTSDPDDSELNARSLDGDEDAFVEVVRRHEAAVGAYLARRAGRDRAEDLLTGGTTGLATGAGSRLIANKGGTGKGCPAGCGRQRA